MSYVQLPIRQFRIATVLLIKNRLRSLISHEPFGPRAVNNLYNFCNRANIERLGRGENEIVEVDRKIEDEKSKANLKAMELELKWTKS